MTNTPSRRLIRSKSMADLTQATGKSSEPIKDAARKLISTVLSKVRHKTKENDGGSWLETAQGDPFQSEKFMGSVKKNNIVRWDETNGDKEDSAATYKDKEDDIAQIIKEIYKLLDRYKNRQIPIEKIKYFIQIIEILQIIGKGEEEEEEEEEEEREISDLLEMFPDPPMIYTSRSGPDSRYGITQGIQDKKPFLNLNKVQLTMNGGSGASEETIKLFTNTLTEEGMPTPEVLKDNDSHPKKE